MIGGLGSELVIALVASALLGAALLFHLFGRWRHSAALVRARRLAALLRDPATTLGDIEDRSDAIEELVEFRDTQAAVQAARQLLSDNDANLRSAAIEVLRRTRALDLWSRDLRRGNYRAKLAAIEALGEVGDERAVDELVEALADDDPDVAGAVTKAVTARDPDYAADRLADALASPNRRLAETAGAALVHMGDDAVEALVSQLGSLNPQARRLAVESIGAIGSPRLADTLIPLLDSDPEPAVRAAAADAIARLGGNPGYHHLRKLSHSDPDWFVRARAYSLLAETSAPGATECLLAALRDIQSDLVRSEDEGEGVEVVLHGAQRVRTAIVAGLRMLGLSDQEIAAAERRALESGTEGDEDPGAAPADDGWADAFAALRERDSVRRAEGARALGNAGRPAVPALTRALRDPEPLVRTEAARSLGKIDVSDCLVALAERLSDPDANVRVEASVAMRTIISRDAARKLTDG